MLAISKEQTAPYMPNLCNRVSEQIVTSADSNFN